MSGEIQARIERKQVSRGGEEVGDGGGCGEDLVFHGVLRCQMNNICIYLVLHDDCCLF